MNSVFSTSPLLSFDLKDQKKIIAFLVWLGICLFCVIQSLITHRYNNYLIFENTFRNLMLQQSFYDSYPNFHYDSNHYGPVFSVFFMLFALLPNWLGFLAWNLFNGVVLLKAIETIPLKNKNVFYFMAIPCFAAASLSQQFNPAAGAFIILSFTQLNKNKGFWSAMFVMLGTFIKLYGIIGLAFFFFVKDKKRFVAYLLFWAIVFFALPMLFSSPTFIINSYQDWMVSLIGKNQSNISENSIDISIMGFIRTVFVNHTLSNTVFLLIGIGIFGLPYLNFRAYKTPKFQLYILASALLFPVLFSTGSEDCTYIIAVSGVAIWYVFSKKERLKRWVFWIIFIFSLDLPLLLFPKIASKYPILLRMESVPFFIIWLFIIASASLLAEKRQMKY